MIHELELSDRTIKYDLQRKKVKNINLRIKPSGDIFISADKSVSIKKINGFILSKEKFITKALDNGLILINAGTNVIRFIPPLVITKSDVDEMIKILEPCLL